MLQNIKENRLKASKKANPVKNMQTRSDSQKKDEKTKKPPSVGKSRDDFRKFLKAKRQNA